jgi:hypothetical protein
MHCGFWRPLSKTITQQPTRKQAAAMEGTTEGRRDEQEAKGRVITSFLEGVEDKG